MKKLLGIVVLGLLLIPTLAMSGTFKDEEGKFGLKTKFKKCYYNFYLTSFIIFFFILVQCISSEATEIDLDEKPTLNKEIIYGKLDNNFTYYIKQNVKPKKKQPFI